MPKERGDAVGRINHLDVAGVHATRVKVHTLLFDAIFTRLL